MQSDQQLILCNVSISHATFGGHTYAKNYLVLILKSRFFFCLFVFFSILSYQSVLRLCGVPYPHAHVYTDPNSNLKQRALVTSVQQDATMHLAMAAPSICPSR